MTLHSVYVRCLSPLNEPPPLPHRGPARAAKKAIDAYHSFPFTLDFRSGVRPRMTRRRNYYSTSTRGANSLLVGHARLPHRLSHVLTLALRTLVRAELRLADLPPESSCRVSGMRAGRASRRTGGGSDPCAVPTSSSIASLRAVVCGERCVWGWCMRGRWTWDGAARLGARGAESERAEIWGEAQNAAGRV